MSGGLDKILEELEKDVVGFVKEEVHDLEEAVEEKSVYTDKFKGDVLGKHDPYDEDSGDHQAHSSESAVPEPSSGAEWFPAVKGAAGRKGRDHKADTSNPDEQHRKGTPVDRGGDVLKRRAADAQEKASSTNATVGASSVKSSDNTAETAKGGFATSSAVEPASKQMDKVRGDQKRKTESEDVENDMVSDQKFDLNNSDKSRTKRNTDSRGNKGEKQHTLTKEDASEVGGLVKKGEEVDVNKHDDLSAGSRQETKHLEDRHKEPTRRVTHPSERKNSQDLNASSPEYERQESADTEAVGNSIDAEDSPQAHENRVFHKKAASIVADLDDLSQQGKQAKEKKEILRGVRRTLSKPHKLYKDPERLAAVRSGDDRKLTLSLKRHGRTIEPLEDFDPKDISADPKRLQAVRKNHRLAMRHVMDLGNQYGMDPFDGLDPEDVQAVIEHHAAHHPHRKHQQPYPPARHEEQGNVGDESTEESWSPAQQAHHKPHRNIRALQAGQEQAERQYDVDPTEDHEDHLPVDYPRLEEAAAYHSVGSKHSVAHRHKKQKRSYPKPYTDNEHPGDLQLASDSLSKMAGDVDDQEDVDSFDTMPPHKRKAHAAKRMLKCIHRVRSFQQDPSAYEGAFVDEAEESGAYVNGMSPAEIEQSYYALKSIAPDHRAKKKKHKHHKHAHTQSHRDYGDSRDDEVQLIDETESEYHQEHSFSGAKHKHKHHKHKHNQHQHHSLEGASDQGGDDYANDNGRYAEDYQDTQANVDVYDSYAQSSSPQEGYNDGEIPDIETYSYEGAGDADPNAVIDPSQIDPSQMTPEMLAAYGIDPNQLDPSMLEEGVDGEGADPASMLLSAASGFLGGGDAQGMMSGVASLLGNGDAQSVLAGVSGFLGGGSAEEVGQVAGLLEGAVGSLSEVEGSLSEVESLGTKAESASSKIKGMKNARANFAKMVNLCSNPIDSLTEGDNVLAGVAQLAMHPQEALDQAKSLIDVGKQGIAALAAVKSPSDALGAVMGMAMQIQGGGDDEMDPSMIDPSQMTPEMMAAYGIDPSMEADPEQSDVYAQEEEGGAEFEETAPEDYPEAFSDEDAYGSVETANYEEG